MKEQAATIAALEERLDQHASAPDAKAAKSDKKRIRELESDVESLKVHAFLQCWICSRKRCTE